MTLNPIELFIKAKDYIVDKWKNAPPSNPVPNRLLIIAGILAWGILYALFFIPRIIENFPLNSSGFFISITVVLIIVFLFLLAVVVDITNLYLPLNKVLIWLLLILIFISSTFFINKAFRHLLDRKPIVTYPEKEINLGINAAKKVLIAENTNCISHKDERMRLYGNNTQDNMEDRYNYYLNLCPNDPEIQIYLNNIKASKANNFIAIAVPVPISREKEAKDSQEILRGVTIAQSEWNKNGKPKALVAIVDDGYKDNRQELSTAKAITELIVHKKEISGVVGHFSSGATESVASIYRKNDLVAMSPTSTAVRQNSEVDSNKTNSCITNKNRKNACLNPHIFRTASNDFINTEKIIDSLDERDKVAIVYEQDSIYSRAYKSEFEKHFGDFNHDSQKAPKKNPCNFSITRYKNKPKLCLERAIKNGSNMLLLVPTSKNKEYVDNLIKINHKLPKKLSLLGSDSMYKEEFIRDNSQKPRIDSEGMLVFIPWQRDDSICRDGEETSRLECKAAKILRDRKLDAEDRHDNYQPFKINWRTATAYDATLALLHGLQISNNKCSNIISDKTSLPPYKCVRRELKNILLSDNFKDIMSRRENWGALGPISFDKKGDREKTGEQIGVVVKAKNGNFVRLD